MFYFFLFFLFVKLYYYYYLKNIFIVEVLIAIFRAFPLYWRVQIWRIHSKMRITLWFSSWEIYEALSKATVISWQQVIHSRHQRGIILTLRKAWQKAWYKNRKEYVLWRIRFSSLSEDWTGRRLRKTTK